MGRDAAAQSDGGLRGCGGGPIRVVFVCREPCKDWEPGRFYGSLGAWVKLGATAFGAARYNASSNVAHMAGNMLLAVHERDKDVGRSVGLSPERRGLHRTAEMDLFPSSCPDENASLSRRTRRHSAAASQRSVK